MYMNGKNCICMGSYNLVFSKVKIWLWNIDFRDECNYKLLFCYYCMYIIFNKFGRIVFKNECKNSILNIKLMCIMWEIELF